MLLLEQGHTDVRPFRHLTNADVSCNLSLKRHITAFCCQALRSITFDLCPHPDTGRSVTADYVHLVACIVVFVYLSTLCLGNLWTVVR